MKILVIDDNAEDPKHPRGTLLSVLKDKEDIDFDLITPTEASLKPKLQQVESYNLILVDYKFDPAVSPVFKTGASLYSLLRDYTKSIPIYLVSVLSYKTNQFGRFDLFIKDEFIESHKSFKQELLDHSKLKSVKSVEEFKELIQAPSELSDDLDFLLKPVTKQNIKDCEEQSESEDSISRDSTVADLGINLFRWLVRSLLHKEGPLLGKEGAAQFLGVSLKFFITIEEQFESCKYSGIFNHSMEHRWWKCLLEDQILSLVDEDGLLDSLPFEDAAPRLLKADENSEYAKCIVCEKLKPNTLGVIEGDENRSLYPVHIHCSEFDESTKQEPYFSNPRIIKGE